MPPNGTGPSPQCGWAAAGYSGGRPGHEPTGKIRLVDRGENTTGKASEVGSGIGDRGLVPAEGTISGFEGEDRFARLVRQRHQTAIVLDLP